MKAADYGRSALSIYATIVLLSACGELQPPIDAPGAVKQSAEIATPKSVSAVSSHRASHGASSGYQVLYSFRGGSDGVWPDAALIDVNGTLYGTTVEGGSSGCRRTSGCGTVYSISTSGTEAVLHLFRRHPDGNHPDASLLNVNGTLYGTTDTGGVHRFGTVYSISTSGHEKVLYSFDLSDGAFPIAGLINVNGTLYGTTQIGGSYGYGTVFSISASGAEKVLHNFANGSDGSNPTASLINVNGTLYGTTHSGGSGCSYGCGTVYSISTSGVEKVLHNFAGGSDGVYPYAGLINVHGTLYGTTEDGGGPCHSGYGCGTIYSISASGAEKVLHRFTGGRDGGFPWAGLIDVNGTLYGTTVGGGAGCSGSYGCGTIYSLSKSGVVKVLHRFGRGSDGVEPVASLLNVNGTLYGTTFEGGSSGVGTVFAFTP